MINWSAKHKVFVNREFSVAFVKTGSHYMELDDYRYDGGEALNVLPPYSEEYGVFTNAQIQNMEYPS